MTFRGVGVALALTLCAAAAPVAQQAATKAASSAKPAAAAAGPQKIKPQDLTLERVYRVKPYQGRAAANLEFSRSGRYLAYLWNPYGVHGSDLYLVEVATGKTTRVTSIDVMKAYDSPDDIARFIRKAELKEKQDTERQQQFEAQADYLAGKAVDLSKWEKEKLEELKKETAEKKAKDAAKKKEKEEADKKAGVEKKDEVAKKDDEKKKDEEKEDWEWRDELRKKLEKEAVKTSDLYPGVSQFVWAKDADELIFTYRGDLFRYSAAKGDIRRLTMSDRAERALRYVPGDGGYFYSDGTAIFRAAFDSPASTQVNREIFNADDVEKKFRNGQTTVSPDGKWMTVQGYAAPAEGSATPGLMGQGRQVEIMTYKERFAKARKVNREMPDDKRDVPPMQLWVRPVPSGNGYAKQPEPVFSYDGGDIWIDMTPIEWSENGERYTFATWEREKDLLRIYCGRAAEGAKPEVVYESKGNVGHEVTNVINPKLTPDGKTIVAVLDEEDGYRQPYAIDVATKGKRLLVKGAFETNAIVGFTPDSKTVFVTSSKEDPAMLNVYTVDLASGEMTAVGKPSGMHRATAVSRDGKLVASVFGNWNQRPELFLIDREAKTEKMLTDSHDKAWDEIDLVKPELFKYKNRHGDTLAGLVFKPVGWKPADRRPGIVYVYGGPLGTGHTIEADTFHGSTYLFAMYMAAKHGYVMVAVDPRGQSGYGRKFAGANWNQVGKPQVEDLEDLVKFMATGFGVDTKKLGLHGWSFGGFQTQMTLYTSPDTFACGVAGAGPTEWENYNSWYSGRTIGKSVRGKPTLRKFSLIPLAKNLKKPLLLMHGMDDDNVLYQDTVNVYRALLESGKEGLVDLFLDPEGGHGLGGAVQRKGQYRKYETFFLRHLGPAVTAKR